MGFGGQSRKRIERRLSAAYATGLLSEDTYVGRLDELLSATIVDPVRIEGDLSLRREETRPFGLIPRTVGTVLERARVLAGRKPGQETTSLLALDWSGVTTELSVGRHARCDIVLLDPAVSRRHARLRFRDGRWILQDLESKNGSYVNGVRVGRSEVRAGDVLTLGDRRLVVD